MGVRNVRRERSSRSGGSGRRSYQGGGLSGALSALNGGAGGGGGVYDNVRTAEMSDADAILAVQDLEAQRTTDAPEVTPDDKTAAALVRLLSSPDKKAQKAGVEALTENYDIIKPATAEKYGLSEAIGKLEEAKAAEKVAKGDWKSKALGTVGKGLELISRPQQAVMELVQAAAVDTGLANDRNALDPTLATPELMQFHEEQRHKGGYKDAFRALTGDTRYDPTRGEETRNLGYAEALGFDSRKDFGKGGSKIAGKVADFVGGAALDPLNLVGGPGAKEASRGLQAGARAVGRDLAVEGTEALAPRLGRKLATTAAEDISEEALTQAIKRTGLRKALTSEQKAAARQLLIDETPANLTTKRLLSRTARTVELKGDRGVRGAVRSALGRETRTGAERAADRTLSAAVRYDRGGLRVGQRSLVPESVRGAVRPLLRDELAFTPPRVLREGLLAEATSKTKGLESTVSRQDDLERAALERAGVKAGLGTRKSFAETPLETLRADLDTVLADGSAGLTPKAQKATLREVAKADAYAAKATDLTETANRFKTAIDTEDIDGLRALDPGLGNANATARTVTNPRNLGSRITRSKIGETLSTGFKNRTGITRSLSLPAGTAEKVYELSTAARSSSKQSSAQLLRTIESAAKSAGQLSDDELTVIRDALETAGSVPAVASDLRAQGQEAQAALLETLDTVRTSDYNTLVDSGLADALKLRAPDEYLPHVYTKEGRKAANLAEKTGGETSAPWLQASGAKAAGNQGGSLEARTVLPDLNITDKNAALQADLVADGALKEGKNVLEQDPRRLVAERGLSIRKAQESADFVDSLAKEIKDPLGGDLVARIRPGATADEVKAAEKVYARRGLQKVDLGESGTAYVHPDLVPEVKNVLSIVSDDEASKAVVRLLDGWNSVWKGYATVPAVGGVGFHSRNSIGNVYNNFLAGVWNPKFYGEAATLQKDIASARRAFPELGITEAMERKGLDAGRIAKVEAALENGVIDEGFFGTDLAKTSLKKVQGASRKSRAGSRLNPLSPDNALVASGTAVGSAIEDNARMAHFLSKLDETGNIADSAMSVKKYLFDYGDLTPFERKGLKRVNAFYTFTRKNTPLQFAELARNPAKAVKGALAERTFLGNDQPRGSDGPDYLSRAGGSYLGADTSRLITGNSNPVIGGIDTPLKSALDTIDPLVQAAAITPGLQKLIPKGASDDENPVGALARGILGNLTGGPQEALKIAFEEASGNSAFTGAPIRDSAGDRRVPLALRLSNAIFPIVGKAEKTYNLTGTGTDSARLRLVKAITGLTAKEITPEVTEKEYKRRVYSLQQALEELQADGVNVPTIQQLRRAKVIPTPEPKKRKAN